VSIQREVSAVAERLKLVESWNELRVGIIVVYSPCAHCGASHRAILTSYAAPGRVETHDGKQVVSDGWNYEPAASCESTWGDPGARARIGQIAVTKRRLFIVEDGLEDATTSERRTTRRTDNRVKP
jgi:hypothetical protein